MNNPIVAIVGRPNVGKSTLFNRFLGRRKSVVDDMPGVTRDRIYADVTWNRQAFTQVDTGGYIPRADEQIADAVGQQVQMALSEADLTVMVVDAKTGPTDWDEEMARMIRGSDTPYLLVVNKVDSEHDEADAAAFYGLGLGDPVLVSALSGRKAGDLLDEVISRLPDKEEGEEAEFVPRLTIVGRPNVGKSTFANRLLGEERVVVSDIPGTTRDPVDLRMKREGREFVMVDTAGLRRRARVTEAVEYYSRVRTEDALRRCDTAIVLVDGVEGCTLQDTRIVEEAASLGKGVVLAINKWDLVDKDGSTAGQRAKDLLDRFPSLSDYPITFISALTGQRTWRVIDMALEVFDRRELRIPTGELNHFLEEVNASTPPPSKRGRVTRMMYCVQPATSPPTVLFFTNRPKDVPENYRRFLERRLRERYDLLGTPVRILFRQK